MIINYILFGKGNESNEQTKQLIDLMKKSETLRKTGDPKVAVSIILELKATIEQIHPSLRKSAEVFIVLLKW